MPLPPARVCEGRASTDIPPPITIRMAMNCVVGHPCVEELAAARVAAQEFQEESRHAINKQICPMICPSNFLWRISQSKQEKIRELDRNS